MKLRKKFLLQISVFSFTFSGIGSFVSVYILPQLLFYFVKKQGNILLWGTLFVVSVALALLCFQLLMDKARFYVTNRESGEMEGFGKMLLLLLVSILCWIAVSFLYGALAVGLQRLMATSFTHTQTMLTIEIVTQCLTLLLMPLSVHLLFAFMIGDRVLQGIIPSYFGSIRYSYRSILSILVLTYGVGFLIHLSFVRTEGTILQGLKVLLLAAVGTMGIVLVICSYDRGVKKYKRAHKTEQVK